MASIQIQIQANAKNAIENLKATQSNINNVGDSLVKLEGKLDPSELQDAFASYEKIIDRAAKAMYEAGDAASFLEAKQKVLTSAMDSVTRMNGGDLSAVSKHISTMSQAAMNAVPSVGNLGTSFQSLSSRIASADKSMGGFATKFASVVKNILVFRTVMGITNNVLNKMKTTLAESVQVAAEAEQIYSKLDTVFGKYSNSMEAAIKLSNDIGVSATTAASALSTVGDLLQAQGATTADSLKLATEWVGKFQDIIAFKDIDMSLEEFAQNFMSGAAGNLRNFRTFGSIVKESAVQAKLAADGLDQLTGSQLELAKMTARATLALEQQSNAYGATEREWDSILSVNRRLQEASKAWKESAGEEINEGLKPIKQWWTAILDEINKANAAKKAFNAGTKNINVYDLSDSKTWDKFKEPIVSGLNNGINGDGMAHALTEASTAIQLFGASAEDVEKLLGELENSFDDITFSSGENFYDFVKGVRDLFTEIEGDRELESWIKDTGEGLLNLAQSTDDFVDSLGQLKGVVLNSGWEKLVEGLMIGEGFDAGKYEGLMNASVQKAIGGAETQLKTAGVGKYTNLASSVFSPDSTQAAYKEWMSQVESLYSILYNRMISVGDVTENDLKDVYAIWEAINGQLTTYLEGLERQKFVQEQIEAMDKSKDSYAGNLADSRAIAELVAGGMGEDRAKAITAQKNIYDSALASATTDAEKAQIEESNKSALLAIASWFDYVEKLAEEKETKAAQERAKSAVDSYADSLSDLMFDNLTFGMSDLDKAIAENNRSVERMIQTYGISGDEADRARLIAEKYNDQLRESNRLNEERAKQEAKELARQTNMQSLSGVGKNMLGGSQVGQLINTAISTPGNGWVKALAVLADVIMQTEEWADLMEQLDTLMEPILEMGSYLAKLLSDHILQYMDALNVAVKSIGSAIVIVSAVLEGFYTTIKDGFQKMIGSVVGGVIDGINWLIGWINSTFGWMGVSIGTVGKAEWIDQWQHINYNADMLKIVDEAKTAIEGIWEDTGSLDKKTGGNYSAYAELLRNKYITPEQYANLIGGNKYSSSTTTNGVTITKGGYGNTTYISIGNITLDTDSPEELERYFIEMANGTRSYVTGH